MHTPSHTKLKGDLLLELRDIRLEINKENTTLEKVRADRAFAEKSFKDREERVSEREKVNSRLEEKFDSVAGDAEKWLEVVKKNTKIERESRNMLESENKQIRDDTNFIKVIKIGVIEQLNKEIEDKITLKNSLENNIKDAKEELVKLELKKIKLLQKNKEIANHCETTSIGISKRENAVSEREIALENKKSDLRVWEIRLHKRYGHLMTDTEKILVKL